MQTSSQTVTDVCIILLPWTQLELHSVVLSELRNVVFEPGPKPFGANSGEIMLPILHHIWANWNESRTSEIQQFRQRMEEII